MTIPTTTTTQIDELVYTAAAVILEMLGYTIKKNSNTYPPWKMRLEAKIKETWREAGGTTEGCGD